jgi:hypothetical protein
MADAEGFTGLGCNEALLHGNDIAQGFGRSLNPPRDVCRRVLTRIFPHAPTDLADSDPWTALLWAGGRIEMPSHPQLPSWRPHPAPLTGLSRAGIRPRGVRHPAMVPGDDRP